jgi:hypothetical protein
MQRTIEVMPSRAERPEPAVAVGDDPRSYAMLLSEVYDATMAGNRGPARPRDVIADSWNRLLGKGIDPETRCARPQGCSPFSTTYLAAWNP